MNTDTLYEIAGKNNITIIYTEGISLVESCSVRINNNYYIGINNDIKSSDQNVHMAHELGHCLTGSMYNMYAPLDNRDKHELRADKWAFKTLVPLKKLITAVERGIKEIWELADFFTVTEDFIKKAITYYEENKLLPVYWRSLYADL